MHISNLLTSFSHAFSGVAHALKNQRNFKLIWFASIFIFIFNTLLNFSYTEQIIFVILNFLVLSLELINTSIENLADSTGKEFCNYKKHAKNLAASSVFIISLGSVVIFWIIITHNYNLILQNILHSPASWTLFLFFIIFNLNFIILDKSNNYLIIYNLIILLLILLLSKINLLFFVLACLQTMFFNLAQARSRNHSKALNNKFSESSLES